MKLSPTPRLLLKVASPRAANLVEWWEARREIKQVRYLDFVDVVEAGDLGSLEALLRRAAVDEGLSDFVEAVLERVTAEASREKIDAFGRLLRLVAQDIDRAEVDEAWLMLNAVSDLDPPHLRVLCRLARDGDRYGGVTDYELASMFARGTAILYPMLKALERHGLAGPLRTAAPGDPDGPVEWAIWDFGLLLLERLFPDEP